MKQSSQSDSQEDEDSEDEDSNDSEVSRTSVLHWNFLTSKTNMTI